MCSGYALFSDKSDVKECGDNLRCRQSERNDNIKTTFNNHSDCSSPLSENNKKYENIHRKDERDAKISTVNLTTIGQCKSFFGPGLTCGEKCSSGLDWCKDPDIYGEQQACITDTATNSSLKKNDPTLCGNKTFWNQYKDLCDVVIQGGLQAAGIRCSGRLQHCYYPWYTIKLGLGPLEDLMPRNCSDNSDKIFPIGARCNQTDGVNKFCSTWCNNKTAITPVLKGVR